MIGQAYPIDQIQKAVMEAMESERMSREDVSNLLRVE